MYTSGSESVCGIEPGPSRCGVHVESFNFYVELIMGGDSPVGIAGQSRNRILVDGEIFRTRPDRPRNPPILLYNERRAIPGVNAAGGIWPPTPI